MYKCTYVGKHSHCGLICITLIYHSFLLIFIHARNTAAQANSHTSAHSPVPLAHTSFIRTLSSVLHFFLTIFCSVVLPSLRLFLPFNRFIPFGSHTPHNHGASIHTKINSHTDAHTSCYIVVGLGHGKIVSMDIACRLWLCGNGSQSNVPHCE